MTSATKVVPASAPGAKTTPPVQVAPQVAPQVARSSKSTKSARAKSPDTTAPIINPEYRRALIAEAAYLRAERRHFAPGYEVDDWLNAESEVDTRLTLGVVPSTK
jgi:hypothetical protein